MLVTVHAVCVGQQHHRVTGETLAPADRPEIAVAVMLANDERWWQKGNQVGREVLRAYFEGKRASTPRRPR